jgi:YbbR domain-containing protein
MVINPPTRSTITVNGLADTIATVTSNSVVVTIDLTKVTPGPNVKVTPLARSLVPGLTIQNPPNPVALNIDRREVIKLTVAVRTPRITPGWEVTKAEARCPTAPCSVTFDGPLSMESNLKAYADFTSPVENSSYQVPTQTVVLEQNGTPLDLAKFNTTIVPPPTLDIYTVSIHIEAKTGTTSRQVVLIDSAPSNPPPNCYRVTNVSIDPITVIITGSPSNLNPITTLTLPAVDLSKATSSATFKVTIPYPDAVSGSAATAKVIYSIAQNPNCASPSP